ncbi:MAG: carbamoyltransferase HypF [Gammaproteobacteria bacterium]
MKDLNHTRSSAAGTDARRITVTGRVQGVGFRPFVSRLAQQLGLSGWVLNRAGQVELMVQGTPERLDAFERDLIECAPPLAIPSIAESCPSACSDLQGFEILSSEFGDIRQGHIPPDFFICGECLAEMRDPNQRRYRYPFINCTQCGPRYTLIERLPYDRPNTTMAGFPLCSECRAEYENNRDRRFHAQPLACPKCGPTLTFRRAGCDAVDGNEAALAASIDALRNGQIVAVKGVGGYHLVCDASSEQTVQRLRQRKHRPDKPLAVMLPCRDRDAAESVGYYAEPVAAEMDLLCDPLRPIVLIKKKRASGLAEAVAPGIAEIGFMLPYSPLHYLLLEAFSGPVVATSANISGEPVLTDAEEVENRLGAVADAFLHHNRPIRRPADDAVYRYVAGRMRPLRLGRGCAPLEFSLPVNISEPVLAVGAQMKNTVALAWDDRVVISPHIGDLGSRRSQEVFEQVIVDLSRLYGIEIKRVVCDAHPDYRSTRWAERSGWPVQRVFHHHAHASALAGEYDLHEPMLVFTWDGTGFGEDGSLWGGEALLGSPGHWRRVCSFRPFRLPGGESAGREPWRSALALLLEVGASWAACPRESELLKQAWLQRLNSPVASSTGRLFDAASALLGLRYETSYEGQAALELEAVSVDSKTSLGFPLTRRSDGLWLSDWAPMLSMLQDSRLSVEERGSQFHASLANNLLSQARIIREEWGVDRVGLTGGVFQNRLLTGQAVQLLRSDRFQVFLPERIPSNDAGISFGQIIEAGAGSNLFMEG